MSITSSQALKAIENKLKEYGISSYADSQNVNLTTEDKNNLKIFFSDRVNELDAVGDQTKISAFYEIKGSGERNHIPIPSNPTNCRLCHFYDYVHLTPLPTKL